LHSIYDKSRVWLLGAYYVAAKDVHHGRVWAAQILGIWGKPETWTDMVEATQNIRRPLYHVMWKSRIRYDHRPEVNRVLTGVRLMMNPITGSRLAESEVHCVDDAMKFVVPVLDSGPEEALTSVQRLALATLKVRNIPLAS
jgi:hypothetical protein